MMMTDGRDGATGAAFPGLFPWRLLPTTTYMCGPSETGLGAPVRLVCVGAEARPFEVPPSSASEREFEEIKAKVSKGPLNDSPSFTKEKRREETEKGPDERAMSGRLAGWGWARHRPSVRRPGAWLPGFPDFPPWPPPLLDRGVRDAPPRRLLPWSLSALSGSREDNEGVFPTGGKPSIVSSL